jgi:hypothetical protein
MVGSSARALAAGAGVADERFAWAASLEAYKVNLGSVSDRRA